MPKITLTGIDARVDGSYDLDLDDSFSYGELNVIKKVAGVTGGKIGQAMEDGDTDIIIALTKITLDRHGIDLSVDRLMAAKIGQIEFGPTDAEKAADEEEEQVPPPSAPTGATEKKSDSSTGSVSTSNGSDDLPETPLAVIGVQASQTGSGSNPPT